MESYREEQKAFREVVRPPTKEEIKEDLTEMQLQVKFLRDQVRRIASTQFAHRQRQNEFRNVAERTNSNLFWWAVIQVSIFYIVVFYVAQGWTVRVLFSTLSCGKN